MTVLFVISHLLILGLMATTTFAAGRLLSERVVFPSLASELAVAVSLGLGALGLAGLALGLLGWLHPAVVLGLVAALHGLAWRHGARVVRRPRTTPLSKRHLWTAGLSFAIFLPALLVALYPPSAFDATMYHLPYAQLFSDEGRVVFASDLRFPVFPQLVDLLFTLVFLVADDVSTALVQTLAMLGTALLLYAWLNEERGHWTGLLAAAVWLGNPLVLWNARDALVDVSLAYFVVLAAYGLAQWFRTGMSQWLLVGAAGCGFAAGTKYHGLIFCGVFGAILMAQAVLRRRWKPAVLGLVAATLVAIPWYARNTYHTGNPFFPFFTQVFGESEWSFHLDRFPEDRQVPDSRADEDTTTRYLTGAYEVPEQLIRRILRTVEAVDLWKTPWRLSFDSQHYGRAPVSPIYLLCLPWMMWTALRGGPGRAVLLTSLLYGVVWLGTADDPRYLLPVLGLLAVPAAHVLTTACAWLGSKSRWLEVKALPLGVLLLVAPGVGYATYKLTQLGPLPVTVEAREAFLSQGSKYAAVHFLNQTYGDTYTAYGLRFENMIYHADGRLLGDHYGPARFIKVFPLLNKPQALYDQLREFGTRLFMVPQCGKTLPPSKVDRKLFRMVYRERGVCIYELIGGDDKNSPRAQGQIEVP